MRALDLKLFEEDIAKEYEAGKIRAPIHLRGGNEQFLTTFFQDMVEPQDYVFSTWGSHLHALLKGVPPERVKDDILAGKSITLHYPDYNFYTSAIVGGICPIAVGNAWALKQRKDSAVTFVFIGDMAFRTGTFHESFMYAVANNLRIFFVVEDNGKSVGTPTKEAWGGIETEQVYDMYMDLLNRIDPYGGCDTQLVYYKYELTYPHAGCGKFIEF